MLAIERTCESDSNLESPVSSPGNWWYFFRVKTLQQELVALRKQHDDVTLKLAHQHDVMTKSVARAVERGKAEQEAEVISLREELRRSAEDVEELKNELKKKMEEKLAGWSGGGCYFEMR